MRSTTAPFNFKMLTLKAWLLKLSQCWHSACYPGSTIPVGSSCCAALAQMGSGNFWDLSSLSSLLRPSLFSPSPEISSFSHSSWPEPHLAARSARPSPRSTLHLLKTWTPSGHWGQDTNHSFLFYCLCSVVIVGYCSYWRDLVFAGLPPVLCSILWLLWSWQEDWESWIPAASCLLPCWNGCVCLQLHHSSKKVIVPIYCCS